MENMYIRAAWSCPAVGSLGVTQGEVGSCIHTESGRDVPPGDGRSLSRKVPGQKSWVMLIVLPLRNWSPIFSLLHTSASSTFDTSKEERSLEGTKGIVGSDTLTVCSQAAFSVSLSALPDPPRPPSPSGNTAQSP